MKKYTIQFDLEEGFDEFWEQKPSPLEVLDEISAEIENTDLGALIKNIKIVKIVDDEEYCRLY